MNTNKSILFSSCCFTVSAAILIFFIRDRFWLYDDIRAMWLSGIIAVGKWVIAVVSAWLLPQKLRWNFLHAIAVSSLFASGLLLSYYLIPLLPIHISGRDQLTISISLSFIATAWLHYNIATKRQLPLRWWLGWLLCSMLSWILQWNLVL